MRVRPTGIAAPDIARLIRYKISRLIGTNGFRRGDEEELQHDLEVLWFFAKDTHDPRRGKLLTYANKIIKNRIATLVEHQTAKKRDQRRNRPLDSFPEPAVTSNASTTEQVEMAMDIHEAMKAGDDDMRDLVALHLDGHTFAEMERITGHTRQSVRSIWGRVEKLLKEKLEPKEKF